MAPRVTNTIATRTRQMPDKTVEYKVGDETVKLSPSIIRNYLVSGNGPVTDQEIAMFLNLCRYQHLNPFLREAYLIKYGNQAATMVVGKDAILKRAFKNPKFAGHEAGVIVFIPESGELDYRPGALVLDGEQLVGGWAKVHVKDYNVPVEVVASFKEYAGKKKNSDGSWTLNSQWASKPATMIRKVALTQALREAFPEDLGGLYGSEEMNVDIDEMALAPVNVEEATVMPEVIEEPQPEPEIQPATMEDIGSLF